ncbi:MAG: proline--tRNA ligase [Magnetococcales bacterium]|nr:proline--tRNA ligase [Magnetococcales bacterium]
MRLSRLLVPTLREDPGEAQIVSHRLMLRAGLIRQLTAGIYTWLPMGLRVLRRVEAIVREEMNAAGAQEILMPAVQPAKLWEDSGRWELYGRELLRFVDRHDRPCCFGPTHEEVVTDLVRRELQSYRRLPVNFYQIQTKFRDEIRPRFGVMRGREFLMKDAYSFDLDEAGLDASYQAMFAAYRRIFDRCGLSYGAVEADTGAIGGAFSHEFHVLADSGEDTIVTCDSCDYAANLEKAGSRPEVAPAHIETQTPLPLEKIATPGQKSIEEVARFLDRPIATTVKSLVYVAQGRPHLLLLRGDHQANEAKIRALLGGDAARPEPEVATSLAGAPVGSLGPLATSLPVIADSALANLYDFACGANADGWHWTGVNWGRDLPLPPLADLREVTVGEPCPRCRPGRLRMARGIEVGHVFKLGDKYTRAMGAAVPTADGSEIFPLMGCYGIGVSRVVAAAIEQNHDADGIVWPVALAPFPLEIVMLNPNDPQTAAAAEELYRALGRLGIEPLLDDRDERPGVKFKDADLMGIPLRVLVGGRTLKEGAVEVRARKSGQTDRVPLAEAPAFLAERLRAIGPQAGPVSPGSGNPGEPPTPAREG